MNTLKKSMMGAACAVASLSLVSPASAAAPRPELTAHGRGTVQLAGDLDASTITGRGVLVVIDRAGDAKVRVAGVGHRSVGKHLSVYSGFSGVAHITGSNVVVRVVGANLGLAAAGTGHFWLRGAGIYDTKPAVPGGEGRWSDKNSSGTF